MSLIKSGLTAIVGVSVVCGAAVAAQSQLTSGSSLVAPRPARITDQARQAIAAAAALTPQRQALLDLVAREDLTTNNNSKLTDDLDRIAAVTRYPLQTAALVAQDFMAAFPRTRFETDLLGRNFVSVDVTTDRQNVEALKSDLAALGATHIASYSNLVGAIVPVSALDSFENNPHIAFARPSKAVHRQRGLYETQGDFAMGAPNVRPPTVAGGPSGLGVKVGVMSDSYTCNKANATNPNDSQGRKWNQTAAQDLASNEFAPIQILKDLTTAQCSSLQAEDEGRAMIQVVADLAPDSTQLFYTAFVSEADFAAGMTALRAAGADIVVDDVGYSDEPFFEDGIDAQAAQGVHDSGGMYFSSAGNDGSASFESVWHPQTGTFTSVRPADGNTGPALNPDLSGLTNGNGNSVTLANGDSISLVFQWDSPFKTGSKKAGAAGSLNSLNIYLVNATTGAITKAAAGNQTGKDPYKSLNFTASNTTKGTYRIVIELHNGAAPGRIKWIDSGYQAANGLQNVYAFATPAPDNGTSYGHPTAVGVMGVGAAAFFDTINCYPALTQTQAEDFSSFGGTRKYINYNDDTYYTTPIDPRKPDIVAPDGGNTSFFFQIFNVPATSGRVASCLDTDGLANNFFGTSEAAPHAAGLAALLKQTVPTATNDQIYAVMRSSAEDMTATAGYDTASGFGFLRAREAVAALAHVSPTAFTFTAQTGVPQNSVRTSNSVTLAGLTTASNVSAPSPISISGGSYSINGGASTSASGYVNNGDSVTVQLTSSANGTATTTATLTIGSYSTGFSVTTADDLTPDSFSFTDVTNAPVTSKVTSDVRTITGISVPVQVTISKQASYSVNGGPFLLTPGTVSNGDTLQLRVSTSTSTAPVTATVGVGTYSTTWTVTVGTDTTADAFTYGTVSNLLPGATTTTGTRTITGINAPAPISVVEPGTLYSVNAGAFTSAPGTVSLNDTVRIQATASSSYGATTTASVNVGGTLGTLTLVTQAADTTPDAFTFGSASVKVGTVSTSKPIYVSGINSATAISISGDASAMYSVNGGAYTNAPGTVNKSDAIRVRLTASSTASSVVNASVTIGGVVGTYSVTATP